MRVLVCGGRDFGNISEEREFIQDHLTKRFPFDAATGVLPSMLTVIDGSAKGVDTVAFDWAYENGCNTSSYPADWKKYGKRAGYVRNKQMLDEGKPDLVIAFPGGVGTQMMVDIARRAGVPVEEVTYD